MEITVRDAVETDAAGIREIFEATYGATGYTYPEYYDESYLKKLIFGDDTIMVVAVDSAGRTVGTASVILDRGAYSDLLGEFGRLAVHPDARHCGVGKLLMEARLERAASRLHCAFVEARVTHPYSVRIADSFGFRSVGFGPSVLRMLEGRESAMVMTRYFGDALSLRRNNPHVVAEVYELGALALHNVGLPNDMIVDDSSYAYPPGAEYELQTLSSEGYSALLRIERGRLRRREVFGRFRLHYGFLRLVEADCEYLIAYEGDRIAGGIGFSHDTLENVVRIFEVICVEERAIRPLLDALVERFEADPEAALLEIDVGAHAARMQRTLVELGFLASAYVPAMAFHEVERVDVVRMVRPVGNLDLGRLEIENDAAQRVADTVIQRLRRRELAPKVQEFVTNIALFRGLSEEQARHLTRGFERCERAANEALFVPGDPPACLWVILEGEVLVHSPAGRELARLGSGQCVGELAMLSGVDHSAGAVATAGLRAAALSADHLDALVRQRPDIALVLYRNVARELAEKLRAANATIDATGVKV